MQLLKKITDGKYDLWIYALFSLLCTFWLNSYFRYTPPLNDGGVFAAIGEKITEGKALYSEVWDNKAPGIFLLNALFIFIFRDPLLAIAALRFVFVFLLGFLMLLQLRNSQPLRYVFMLLLPWLWTIISAWEFFMSGSYTEFYGVVFLLAAFECVCRFKQNNNYRYLFGGAILSAFATMLKEPFALAAIALFFYGIAGRFQVITRFILFGSGFLIPWFVLWLYFAATGAFGPWMEYVKFAFAYAGNSSTDHFGAFVDFIRQWSKSHGFFSILFLAFVSMLSVWKFEKQNHFRGIFLLILFLTQLVFVFLGEQIYGHYYLPLMVTGCYCVMYGMNSILTRMEQIGNEQLRSIVPAFLFLIVAVYIWPDVKSRWSNNLYPLYMKADDERKIFLKKIIPYSNFYIAREDLGRFYLYSEKESSLKYPSPFYIYFIHAENGGTERHLEFARELEKEKPQLILTGNKPLHWLNHPWIEKGNWFQNHYSIRDSMKTAEGDQVWFWGRIR